MFLKMKMKDSIEKDLNKIKKKIEECDAIVIGAGSGLSTSAGFTYLGDRFDQYFGDFKEKYHFDDMYTGGFYPFETLEEFWAYWSRYIYINRYMKIPNNVYSDLYNLVKDKDYFVLTTNVDHCFQKAGFDKKRLFYTQGDFGLLQCSKPCHKETYDNYEIIKKMVLNQGFKIVNDELIVTDNIKMKIDSSLIPYCPKCGEPMTTNLRADDGFVQDNGWYKASDRYQDFIQRHKRLNILFLELGVGYNTPGIIKYPFWELTGMFDRAFYVCLNYNEAYVPDDIKYKSICINGDIKEVLEKLK